MENNAKDKPIKQSAQEKVRVTTTISAKALADLENIASWEDAPTAVIVRRAIYWYLKNEKNAGRL